MPPFRIERTGPTVITVRHKGVAAGWEQWYLLRSDAHHDNAHCDQELERRHLEEAKERGAGILDFGDLFCAMQGKWDRRANPAELRPELRGARYLDDLVNYCAAFYQPYAAHWILLANGNHEQSIQHHHETHLTERLAERLRAAGGQPEVGTYQGWVRFMFDRGGRRSSHALRYTHGYGGGGPVTKDLIQANRQLAYTEGADILVSGHTHDAWEVTQRRETLTPQGRTAYRDVSIIKCGGYKDEFGAGNGYAARKGHAPKPLGAYWLRFFVAGGSVQFEARRAR